MATRIYSEPVQVITQPKLKRIAACGIVYCNIGFNFTVLVKYVVAEVLIFLLRGFACGSRDLFSAISIGCKVAFSYTFIIFIEWNCSQIHLLPACS